MRTNRNLWIELCRFIASICIVIYHFEWLYIGKAIYFVHFYIFVELFFVISGFFLGKNIEKAVDDEENIKALKYTYKQIKKLYLPYVISFVFSWLILILCNDMGIKAIMKSIYELKGEVLLMQTTGLYIPDLVANGVTAQLSALVVATCILGYFIQRYKYMFLNLGWIAIIALYAHILERYGNLSQWTAFEGWFCVGILRAVAGMAAGAWAYIVLYNKIQKLSMKFKCICLVFIVATFAFLVVGRNYISYYDLVLYVPAFAMFVWLMYSLTSKNIPKVLASVSTVGGGISYEIFLVHYALCKLLVYYFPNRAYLKMICVYIFLVLICAVGLKCLSNFLKRHMDAFHPFFHVR